MRKKSRSIIIVVIVILAIIFYGMAYVLWANTLADIRIICALCGGMGLISGTILWKGWKKLTGIDRFLPNYICHAVFTFGFILCMFLMLNKYFADGTTNHVEKVIVDSKIIKKRHKTKRVGRRSYVSDDTYSVYYWGLRFSNGVVKEIQISGSQYGKSHLGDTILLEMENGLFDIPVIVERY